MHYHWIDFKNTSHFCRQLNFNACAYFRHLLSNIPWGAYDMSFIYFCTIVGQPIVKSLRWLSYEKRFRKLGPTTCFTAASMSQFSDEFSEAPAKRNLRRHGFQLGHCRFRLARRRVTFSVPMSKQWNKPTLEVVIAPSVNAFKRDFKTSAFSHFPYTQFTLTTRYNSPKHLCYDLLASHMVSGVLLSLHDQHILTWLHVLLAFLWNHLLEVSERLRV